jgi:RNA polymerase sigma-70 factor (ECF subfamily)
LAEDRFFFVRTREQRTDETFSTSELSALLKSSASFCSVSRSNSTFVFGSGFAFCSGVRNQHEIVSRLRRIAMVFDHGMKNSEVQEQTIPTTRGLYNSTEAATTRAMEHATKAALDELWHSHVKRLLRIAFRITGNHADAEDAVQDSFLRALRHLEQFDGRSSLATWLTRIAVNSALMIVRGKSSIRELPIDAYSDDAENTAFETLVDRRPSPEIQCIQRQQEELLHESILMLSPQLRRAIELQKLQERSLKESAEMMGISVPAAKARVFNAKAEIRESLKSAFFRKVLDTSESELRSAA